MIDWFFFIDDTCLVIFNLFLVSLGLYVDIYIFTLLSTAVSVL